MNLKHIQGNTWVIEGNQLIPIYILPDKRCILMDSGLRKEREELEQLLKDNGLSPAAIVCTHAHVDHCANNDYFQKKYHIPVALSGPETGMASSILNLKCYRLLVSPDVAEQEMSDMVHTPDIVIPYVDWKLELEGERFGIVTTPGHSSGHICVITPDNVCYAGDAIMSREMMDAKLPYSLSIQHAMASRKKLLDLDCDLFVMAHRGICTKEEIGQLIEDNHALILRRAAEILELVDEPMDFSHLCGKVCQRFELFSPRARRALYYERNIRLFIEFLVDRGELDMESRQGVAYYFRTNP